MPVEDTKRGVRFLMTSASFHPIRTAAIARIADVMQIRILLAAPPSCFAGSAPILRSLDSATRPLHQSRVDQKRLRILPKRQMFGVPASMPALIQPKRRMLGCHREALPLLPRDERA